MFQVTYSFSNETEMKAFVDRVSGGGAPAAASGEKRGPGRPAGSTKTASAPAASTAKHNRAEVNAALQEVKDKLSTAAAKELIASIGFQKMNDITEEKFDAAYDAAKALLAEPAGAASDDNDI